jgi:hypothetical protein
MLNFHIGCFIKCGVFVVKLYVPLKHKSNAEPRRVGLFLFNGGSLLELLQVISLVNRSQLEFTVSVWDSQRLELGE